MDEKAQLNGSGATDDLKRPEEMEISNETTENDESVRKYVEDEKLRLENKLDKTEFPSENGEKMDETIETEVVEAMKSLDWNENTQVFEVAQWHSCTPEHYTKGCLFSPDGTCLLAPVTTVGVMVFELPVDLYQQTSLDPTREITELIPAFNITESRDSAVYDMAWYPQMDSRFPETCSFLTTKQYEPIKLYDAFNGQLNCSYRGYNEVDEVEHAFSVCFSSNGDTIYGGYKKNMKIFKTNLPGRVYDTIRTGAPCVSLASIETLIACGSWNKEINVYDTRDPEVPTVSLYNQHLGGITYLKLLTENCLISGARKDNQLIMWDLRAPNEPYFIFGREVNTNQRIYFDTSPEGKWLATGSTDGRLKIWNNFDVFADNHQPIKETSIQLYDDCLNGVSFHPFLPIIATSSGQFRSDAVKTKEDDEKCPNQNYITMWWVM